MGGEEEEEEEEEENSQVCRCEQVCVCVLCAYPAARRPEDLRPSAATATIVSFTAPKGAPYNADHPIAGSLKPANRRRIK